MGPYVIARLREKKIGQTVREEGVEAHLQKSGIPTMGGDNDDCCNHRGFAHLGKACCQYAIDSGSLAMDGFFGVLR